MANTTSANLKLTVQQTGENSGTWGQITNTNLLILEQAIGGYDALSVASSPTALTFSNGALSNGKNQVLKLTGTISGNVIVTIPNTIEKTYIVDNGTSGAHTVTLKYVSGGSSVTWSATDKGTKLVYADGTNVLEGISSVGDLNAEDISADDLTISNITISASTTANTISASGNIATSAGDISDKKGEIRSVPRLDKTSAYTLIATDHGKFIRTNSAITVPPSVFTAGQTVTIFNNSGSSFAITRGSGVVMYWVQTAANADRTLSQRGLATILCVGTNTFVITGGTLS